MTDWVRLWHDMPTDPKWRTIARKSGQPLPCVIALFNLLMVNASANGGQRGSLRNWDNEDAATALDMETEDVAAIMAAMQGKVLDGDRLTGWEKRQPNDTGGGRGFRGEAAYIYFLHKEGTPEVKVGVSKNPWARAADLQTGSPQKIEVMATFKGERSQERDLHRLLQKYRGRGEWFNLPPALLKIVKVATGSDVADLLVATQSYEETETETEAETEEETEKKNKLPADAGLAFDGKVIRLKRRDFDAWRKAYPSIDLRASLQSRDDWLASEADEKTRKRWFMSTSNHLANLQQRAAALERAPAWDGMP